jgi:large subunit ribosomal protein L17
MRHGKKFNHLGRKKGHRKALLQNLACALIEHKRINTTLAKAKALRVFVEPLVTKAKSNTTHARRTVFDNLQNKEAIKELFSTVADKIGDRPGGYTRIIKTGFRKGDAAETAMIEFVDFNEVMLNATKPKSTGRSRRGRKKSSGATTAAAAATAATTVAKSEEE